MRSLVLSTVRPVAVALAVLLVVPPAFARTVRCESWNYRYTYCPVETYGNVTLRRELLPLLCVRARLGVRPSRRLGGPRVPCGVRGGRGRSRPLQRLRLRRPTGPRLEGARLPWLASSWGRPSPPPSSPARTRTGRTTATWCRTGSWAASRATTPSSTPTSRCRSRRAAPSPGTCPGASSCTAPTRTAGWSFSGVLFDVEKTGSGFTLTQREDRNNVVVYHRDR